MRLVARPARLLAAALAAGGLLALAGGPLPTSGPVAAQPAPAAEKVSMKDFAFMPATITIKAGTTVTWTYDESATDPMPNCETPGLSMVCPGHTATATEKGADGKPLFDSGTLKGAGKSYSFTFDKAGTFAYYCIYHGGTMQTGKNNPITNMNGTIVVEAASTASPQTSASAAPQQASTAQPAQVAAAAAEKPATGGELAQSGGRLLLGWALVPLLVALGLRSVRKNS